MVNLVSSAFSRLRKSYGETFRLWRAYWKLYGGVTAVASSLYFFFSVMLSLACFYIWVSPGWWDIVISAVPTMLGFTLAGLAVFLGMDSKFNAVIAGGSDEDPSPFLLMIAAFVHFVVVQVLALAYALVAKSTFFVVPGMPHIFYEVVSLGRPILWFLGFLLFVYAVFSMLAATFAIFTASRWFDEFMAAADDSDSKS
jgi:hypothetical protein